MPSVKEKPPERDAVAPPSGWLMLLHQLPAEPPGLRVRIWRRLQAVGALPLKSAVYLLPDSADAREDFEWIARDVRDAGAEASLWRVAVVDGADDAELVARFQALAGAEYEALEKEIRAALAPRRGKRARPDPRTVARWRASFQEIGVRDFFAAPRREVAGALIDSLETPTEAAMSTLVPPLPAATPAEYRGMTWVTRADVRVDRLASAWLIRRFVDAAAEFRFVRDKSPAAAPREVRFDTYEGEFTHVGELCTFEVLKARFGLDAPGLEALAEIVHDIDVKDGRYGRPEAAGIAAFIDGLATQEPDDRVRIERAGAVFDALLARLAG